MEIAPDGGSTMEGCWRLLVVTFDGTWALRGCGGENCRPGRIGQDLHPMTQIAIQYTTIPPS